jgi:hypothetical protein
MISFGMYFSPRKMQSCSPPRDGVPSRCTDVHHVQNGSLQSFTRIKIECPDWQETTFSVH